MSDHPKRPANEMFHTALFVMSLLTDVCDRLQIGGSLRRDKQEISDIELVMRPKYLEQRDMFGEVGSRVNLLEQRCNELLSGGVFSKRLNKNGIPIAWGDDGKESRYKAILHKGVPIDLFIVLPDRQWGPTMLLRTGPGDANRVLVTNVGIKNREGQMGILPANMQFENGAVTRNWIALDTPEEDNVFAALDLPYIPPCYRSVALYQHWARRRVFTVDFGLSGLKSQVHGYAWHEFNWQMPPAKPPPPEPEGPRLNIAPGLILHPEDFVGVHTAVMGMTGMGKSNCISVLCEELQPHIQMTVVDLEGEYHSLRDELPFRVVGRGEHVDEAIFARTPELLVERIMESGQSVILDLYELDAEERDEYLRRYLDKLFEIEGRMRKPHLVVLEEAPEYLNQQRKTEVSRSAKRIANRGRKRGIGLIMATQRTASLDKDVLNMTRLIFMFSVIMSQDLAVYRRIIPKHQDSEEMATGLRVGQAIVRRAGADGKPKADIFTIRRRRTRDLGKTPELVAAGQLEQMASAEDLEMEERVRRLERV